MYQLNFLTLKSQWAVVKNLGDHPGTLEVQTWNDLEESEICSASSNSPNKNFLIPMMKAVFSNLHRPFNQPGWFSWSSDFKLNFWKSLAQRVRLSRIFCLAFAGPLTRLANRPDFPGNLNSFEFHQNLQIATMPSRDLTPSAFWCFEMRITKHWKFSIKTMFHANSNNVTKVKHRLVNKIGL